MKNKKKIIIYGILLVIAILAVIVLKFSVQVYEQEQINTATPGTDDDIDMSWLYGTATSTIPGMDDSDSYVLLQSDSAVPTYKDFLNNDLQKVCPFYKPDGITYRDCLGNLLADREKAVEQMYSDLVRDTQIVSNEAMAEGPIGGGLVARTNEYFLTNLAMLEKTWKPYRDALCSAELSDTYSGSNQYGYLTTCQIYETTAYETRLIGFRYEYVGQAVEWRIQQNVTPKLETFKELMSRESNL